MIASEKAYELIKHFEGCKLKAYKCSAGVWTIGFGNTFYENGLRVKEGDIITKQRAEELLKLIVKKFELSVDRLLKVDVKQHEFDALVSFCYNVGIGNLEKSTLLLKINKGQSGASLEFLKWTKAKGVVLKGLERRRTAEKILFETGIVNLT
jgi:lysozyme